MRVLVNIGLLSSLQCLDGKYQHFMHWRETGYCTLCIVHSVSMKTELKTLIFCLASQQAANKVTKQVLLELDRRDSCYLNFIYLC